MELNIIDSNAKCIFVTDNGTGIFAAVNIGVAELNWTRIPCLGHSLALCVTHTIYVTPSVKELLRKCSSIAGHFNHSERSTRILNKYQGKNNHEMQPLKLLQRSNTRWNSDFIMVNRMCELQESLTKTMKDSECRNRVQSLSNF